MKVLPPLQLDHVASVHRLREDTNGGAVTYLPSERLMALEQIRNPQGITTQTLGWMYDLDRQQWTALPTVKAERVDFKSRDGVDVFVGREKNPTVTVFNNGLAVRSFKLPSNDIASMDIACDSKLVWLEGTGALSLYQLELLTDGAKPTKLLSFSVPPDSRVTAHSESVYVWTLECLYILNLRVWSLKLPWSNSQLEQWPEKKMFDAPFFNPCDSKICAVSHNAAVIWTTGKFVDTLTILNANGDIVMEQERVDSLETPREIPRCFSGCGVIYDNAAYFLINGVAVIVPVSSSVANALVLSDGNAMVPDPNTSTLLHLTPEIADAFKGIGEVKLFAGYRGGIAIDDSQKKNLEWYCIERGITQPPTLTMVVLPRSRDSLLGDFTPFPYTQQGKAYFWSLQNDFKKNFRLTLRLLSQPDEIISTLELQNHFSFDVFEPPRWRKTRDHIILQYNGKILVFDASTGALLQSTRSIPGQLESAHAAYAVGAPADSLWLICEHGDELSRSTSLYCWDLHIDVPCEYKMGHLPEFSRACSAINGELYATDPTNNKTYLFTPKLADVVFHENVEVFGCDDNVLLRVDTGVLLAVTENGSTVRLLPRLEWNDGQYGKLTQALTGDKEVILVGETGYQIIYHSEEGENRIVQHELPKGTKHPRLVWASRDVGSTESTALLYSESIMWMATNPGNAFYCPRGASMMHSAIIAPRSIVFGSIVAGSLSQKSAYVIDKIVF